MKKILFIFFPFYLCAQVQTEPDSALTVEELNFRDSIAALNLANEKIQLLQESYNEANSFFSSGNFTEAIKRYTNVIYMDSSYVDAYFYRGLAYKEKHQYQLAIIDLKQVFLLDSSKLEALFQIARCFSFEKKYQNSIETYELLLSLSPNEAAAAYEMGVINYLKKRPNTHFKEEKDVN